MKKHHLSLALILLMTLASQTAWGETAPYEPIQPGANGADGRRTPIVKAVEKARPAVVSVYAISQSQRDPFQDDFFNNFFGDIWQQRSQPNITYGSGVVIDANRGLVVTNEHVIRGASKVMVTLSDGRELKAALLGSDPRFDLAVLEVKNASQLKELNLSDSDQLLIGETVIAIGNPFGFSHTVTTGVISATDRSIPGSNAKESLQNLIQTDASINPGNSGGPLINVNGDIVGINTAIYRNRGLGEGLGFAIPANQVKRISARLSRGGIKSAALDVGLELAESGRPKRGETGCLVVEAKAGGPGALGGIRKGDVIMKLDGSPTTTMVDYEVILSSLTPGQSVAAEIVRDGVTQTLNLTPKAISEAEALELAWQLFGLKVFEQQNILRLERPADRSPAQILGLREGDILLSLAGQKTMTKADLAKAILDARFQTSVGISIQRGRTLYKAVLSR